jgi:hypothetical protein
MLECPRCGRGLDDAAGRPNFCMHCGTRLAPDAPSGPAVADPSPHETMAFVPAPSESPVTFAPSPGSPPTAGPPTATSLAAIAGYTFTKFLGAGGMGTVYEAESAATGQRVAVKLLAAKLAANPSSVERFRQEGRVASQITHPRCVFVLRADTESGRPFIIMELMPGRTLKDLVDERGPLAPDDAVARTLDVIDGLAEAHRLGVIHRDVKPSNCFMTEDDRVKVGDFGLSKSLAVTDEDEEAEGGEGAGQLTGTGAFLGTVMFASPEQIRGEAVGYESDVYAVCGTLYYLLTGRAPYQHDSLTASLAKAVSEPPPPIRPRAPAVSRELERVVLRGLERDRNRRWQTLEELRDALAELQPGSQTPARPRAIMLAYLLDNFLLAAVVLAVEVPRQAASAALNSADFRLDLLVTSWPWQLLSIGYFAIGEGVFGTTVGKRLLRLRVAPAGGVGPPGVPAALVRAVVFSALWLVVWLAPELGAVAGGAAGGVAGGGLTVAALVALATLFRRTPDGWRGPHDRASGCRVVQRPRPPHRPRLVSRHPNPLDRLVPADTPLPRALGSFAVAGKLADLPDGGEVWLGDDRSLGRRVLLRVLPPGERPPDFAPDDTRPTRLRVLGTGSFGGRDAGGKVVRRGWVATVAPAGAPLLDVVAPGDALPWVDARPLLEQLANELIAAEADDPPLGPMCVEQVWVELNGRLQLLDFALPTGRGGGPAPGAACPPLAPLALMRQTASLALEGLPRDTPGPVHAPIPPHAARVTDRLFAADNPPTVAEVRRQLVENHAHAPALTAAGRAAHLSVLAVMIGPPRGLTFLLVGLMSFFLALLTISNASNAAAARVALATPEGRESLLEAIRLQRFGPPGARHEIEEAVQPEMLPHTLQRLDARTAEQAREEAEAFDALNRLERPLAERVREERVTPDELLARPQNRYAVALAVANLDPDHPRKSDPRVVRRTMFRTVAGLVAGMPLAWAAFAFLFRGGLSMQFAGVTLVTARGRRAERWRCALRELVVWSPVVGLLLLSLFVQYQFPTWVALRGLVVLAALLLLPLYLAVALRYPTCPPHDRLVGTVLVPA